MPTMVVTSATTRGLMAGNATMCADMGRKAVTFAVAAGIKVEARPALIVRSYSFTVL